jgi:hypothetical protein
MIQVTTLKGTDSLSASRITINDNFKVIEDSLNAVLQVFDVSTGKINNYGYGTDNDIETEDIIVRGSTAGGVNVLSGSVIVNNGNVLVSGYLEFGPGSGVRLEKVNKNFNIAPGNIPTINASGTGGTGGVGSIAYFAIPRLSTSQIEDIQNPAVGAIVCDVSGATGVLKMCFASGVTGSWVSIT